MAAGAILSALPIIAQFAPMVVNLVEGLINHVKPGEKTGSTIKNPLATDILTTISGMLTKLPGVDPASSIDHSSIQGMIETALSDLKASGMLGKPMAPTAGDSTAPMMQILAIACESVRGSLPK